MLLVSPNTQAEERKSMGMSNAVKLRTDSWDRGERMFKEAERKFAAYLARRRNKGEQIRVLMHPYRTAQVRAILEVDGTRMRVYFCERQAGWRRASTL
jgi:hypothetical protein